MRTDVGFVRGVSIVLVVGMTAAPLTPAWAGEQERARSSLASGLSPDATESIARRLAVDLRQPRVIRESAAKELRTQTFHASQGNGGGGSGPSGAAIAGWIGVGASVSGLAFGLYGDSDRCAFNNPSTNVCTMYRGLGLGLVIGGVTLAILGALSDSSTGAGSASSPPRQAPPVQPAPLEPVFDSGAQRAIDEIRGGTHTTMPPPQVAGRNSGGATTWTFRNDTAYTLFVYLAGATTLSLTIPPGGARNASLAAGRYEIGARVSASNVLPFYGVRDYARGYDYSDCFYIESGCSR